MFDQITRITAGTDLQGRLTATVRGLDIEGRERTAEYRTSTTHDGLWEWDAQRRDWRQIKGTGQFAASSATALRRKLRRMLVWERAQA